jgi:RNA-directed DNA polymerase
LEQAFPSWARPPKQRPASLEGSRDAAFRAGASLALLDQIIRFDPPFAGALRQRLCRFLGRLLHKGRPRRWPGVREAPRHEIAGRNRRFCRYADDAVIHCKSQAQAQFVLRRIDERFRQCGLELHPSKTRIVYCKDINRRQDHPAIEFTFLGYTFRPRRAMDKYGRVYVNFSPAVSRPACKAMRQTIRGWHLQLKCDKELADLTTMFDPILTGWQQYYGRFYGSAMSTVWKHVNAYLVRWLMRKYKSLARRKVRAWRALGRLAQQFPRAFVHWRLGFAPMAG